MCQVSVKSKKLFFFIIHSFIYSFITRLARGVEQDFHFWWKIFHFGRKIFCSSGHTSTPNFIPNRGSGIFSTLVENFPLPKKKIIPKTHELQHSAGMEFFSLLVENLPLWYQPVRVHYVFLVSKKISLKHSTCKTSAGCRTRFPLLVENFLLIRIYKYAQLHQSYTRPIMMANATRIYCHSVIKRLMKI